MQTNAFHLASPPTANQSLTSDLQNTKAWGLFTHKVSEAVDGTWLTHDPWFPNNGLATLPPFHQ